MPTLDAEALEIIYRRRFGGDAAFRNRMWKLLCQRFFQRFIAPDGTVLEVGAGYCEFINNIRASQRIAVDLNPDTAVHADRGVNVLQRSSTDLADIPDASVDSVFVSNFFEHITREDILGTMREIARVLRPSGRLLILQPNIRYCWRDFWMFFDHITPLDQYSLVEALEMCGFRAVKMIVRFLPYTTHGRLPKSLLLLRVYLAVPLLWRLFGQQTFVIAALDAAGRRS